MAVFVAYLVIFLAMAGHSSANYCICKDGLSDQALQKSIDYACGAGADCSPILQNGPCYNPNTVKDHCNYAVNSYYQRKGQVTGSCDFSGTAVVSQTVPSASSGCVFPSSPSNAGSTTTPSTNPTTSPTGSGTGTGTGTGTGAGTGTGTGTGTSTNPITTPTGSTTGTGFGLGPTGSGITSPDGSGSSAMSIRLDSYLLVMVSVLGLMWRF